jgi:hypothetical protein
MLQILEEENMPVARKTSERTRTIREVVQSVPSEKVNEVSLTDLQPLLQEKGVSVETDREKFTVYSELTRRRRQLGRLSPSVKKRRVRLPTVPTSQEDGVFRQDGQKPREASSAEYIQDLRKLAAAYERIKDQIRVEGWEIDVPSVMMWIGTLDREVLLAIHGFSEKHGCARLVASAVAFLVKERETAS